MEQKKLPDPFIGPDGTRITSPAEWPAQKKYLMDMLDHFLYGPMPPQSEKVSGTVIKSEKIYNAAIADTVKIDCGKFQFEASIKRPDKPGKFPVVCGYTMEPVFSVKSFPAEQEALCERDYVLATINVNAIAFDKSEGGGPIYDAYPEFSGKAIMAWSWGIMRLNDYLLQCDFIDPKMLIAAGCSRLGKQTICTALHDERIALAGVAGSGCGGFGSFRILGTLKDGQTQDSTKMETIGRMSQAFPHWFSENMLPFGSAQSPHPVLNEYRLPFDMHFARACLAPRYVLASNALEDTWGNLYGDWGTYLAAQELYQFLGAEDNTAFFYRPGTHRYDESEFLALLDFADAKLRGLSPKGFANLNKAVFTADKKAFFDWERP
ncbi:hypothetical protein FACS189476_00920 [Spirochaetia bacterium]|nr:hypothetical protein FACS189476_00920 [Spirochaetia bacterium]